MGHFSDFYRALVPWKEDVWIETGTYQGESIRRALAYGFKEIHSIEVCPRLYEAAHPLFARHRGVHLHQGSSPAVLERLLTPDVTARSTVFWLDAHFQGCLFDEMDPTIGQCPLLAELDIILSQAWTGPLMFVIDDIGTFKEEFWTGPLAHRFSRPAWPSLEAIKSKLQSFAMVETEECLYAWQEAAC